MRKSLGARILSIILSLSLLAGMIPLPVAAAGDDVPVATEYVDVLRMSFLEGDKLVAAAYGEDALSKDVHLGDRLYLQFTWPFNEEALDIEVIGPTSGALFGIPFLQHITPEYSDSERIYKPSGMTPYDIKVQLGLRSDFRELWAVPGLGYNGLPMSMWDQAGIMLSNAADAMGFGGESDSALIQPMSLTGGGLAGEGADVLAAEEVPAAAEEAVTEEPPADEAGKETDEEKPTEPASESEETGDVETPAPPTESPDVTETPEETPVPTEAPIPTETPEATETPEPTETPEATATPEPTEAPEPTETPEPTPEVATPETAAHAGRDRGDGPAGIRILG